MISELNMLRTACGLVIIGSIACPACNGPTRALDIADPDVSCGVPIDGGSGLVTISGTFQNQAVPLKSAAYDRFVLDGGVDVPNVLELYFSSGEDQCSLSEQFAFVAGSWSVLAAIGPIPSSPGTFPVRSGPPPGGVAGLAHLDSECHGSLVFATSGYFRLDCLEPVAGAFEFDFPGGDHLIGQFIAPDCQPPSPLPTTMTCQR
jgi:hypothetical protein